jgi:hypothetical protein
MLFSSGFPGLDKFGKAAVLFFSKNTRLFLSSSYRLEFGWPETTGVLGPRTPRSRASSGLSSQGGTMNQFFVPHFAFFSLFLSSRSTRTPQRSESSSCRLLPHSKKERHSCRYYFGGAKANARPALRAACIIWAKSVVVARELFDENNPISRVSPIGVFSAFSRVSRILSTGLRLVFFGKSRGRKIRFRYKGPISRGKTRFFARILSFAHFFALKISSCLMNIGGVVSG